MRTPTTRERARTRVFENADSPASSACGACTSTPPRKRPADRARRGRRGNRSRRRGAADQIGWRFSHGELKQELTLSACKSSPTSRDEWALLSSRRDVEQVGGSESAPRMTLAALGPGSGLGVSALVPTSDGWAVMTGEGGHVTMAAATREEQDVIAILRERFDGHCSAERVLSGPGLVTFTRALRARRSVATVNPGTARIAETRHRSRADARHVFAMSRTVAADLAAHDGAREALHRRGNVPRVVGAFARSSRALRSQGAIVSISPRSDALHHDGYRRFAPIKHLLGYR